MAAEIPGSKDVAPPRSTESNEIGGFSLDRLQNVIPGIVAGSLKGNTVDFLGLPVDVINEILGVVRLKSSKPIGGSDSLRGLLGIKSTAEDTSAEVGGSFLSPAGAAKAMIVGAARVLKKEGVAAEAISKIKQTAKDANSMEMAGVKANVFNSAGVYATKGDDVVRAIISDAGAKINPGATSLNLTNKELKIRGGATTLEDILRHDELFALYPELKDYKVRNTTEKGVGEGMHIPSSRVIELGPMESAEQMRSVLLHETQHAVQAVEGMNAGGTAREFLKIPRPAPQKIASIQKMAQSTDSSLADPAQRFLNILNTDYRQAYDKYLNIPGETEARFTQRTRLMDKKDINAEVSRLIATDTPQSLWDK